jgi:hypothetical protein
MLTKNTRCSSESASTEIATSPLAVIRKTSLALVRRESSIIDSSLIFTNSQTEKKKSFDFPNFPRVIEKIISSEVISRLSISDWGSLSRRNSARPSQSMTNNRSNVNYLIPFYEP